MSRLLNRVEPDHLFMGQKDFQQCLVVQRLIRYPEHPVGVSYCANGTGEGWSGPEQPEPAIDSRSEEKCDCDIPGIE